MNNLAQHNAEYAAREANEEIIKCIQQHKSFVLEAGAGSGKTESLIRTLQYLIKENAKEYRFKHKKIACITYTNVAQNEIDRRTDNDPVIYSGTIHSFCWSLMQNFQVQLRKFLLNLEKWQERLGEVDCIDGYKISYTLGHPKCDSENFEIYLYHNDVLTLFIEFLSLPKFRSVLTSKHPIIFIDEYQDTDVDLMQTLEKYFFKPRKGPVFGLFGDAWQKIYGNGCGKLDVAENNLYFIAKKSNFRSEPVIVNALNNIRPELPQIAARADSVGCIRVFHTNDWNCARMKGQHHKGDLNPNDANLAFKKVHVILKENGWDFEDDKMKILMLTHKGLAREQGYQKILDVFFSNEFVIKKEDPFIAYFVDTIEPLCLAYSQGQYGKMLDVLKTGKLFIKNKNDKKVITDEMNDLLELRKTGLIKDVLLFLSDSKFISLPVSLKEAMQVLEAIDNPENENVSYSHRHLSRMYAVPYNQIIPLKAFIENYTPFQTQHGVKGAEFENVLVLFGRGWNQYDFNKFLEYGNIVPCADEDFYIRNRNLFYVACSRPQKNLTLLFTQELSASAMVSLEKWFGKNNIYSLPIVAS